MKKILLKILVIILALNFTLLYPAENSNEIKKKNLKRAIKENLILFAYSFPSYWIRHNIMKEDWEFKFTWEDQSRRIFGLEGVKFDSNTFQFNWTHSLSGSLYHNFARVNNLNLLESFLFSSTVSLLWETFNEFREVISINDVIFTPMGGLTIGESLYNLGLYNYSNNKGIKQKLLTLITNPVIFLNDLLSKKNKPKKNANFSSLFKLSFSQQFNINYNNDTPLLRLDFNSKLFNNKFVYDKKNKLNIFTKGTLFSSIDLDILLSFDKIEEYSFYSKIIYSGKTIKKVYKNNDGYLKYYGLSSSYDFFKEMYDIKNPDRYAVINLFGYDFNYLRFKRNLEFYFGISAYIHFSLINSIGFREYHDEYNIVGTKTTLMQYNYYYAWGSSIYFNIGLNVNKFSLSTNLKYMYFSSIEGLDRFEEYLINDFHLNDSRLITKFKIGYDNNSIGIFINIENFHRHGIIREFVKNDDKTSIYTQISFYL